MTAPILLDHAASTPLRPEVGAAMDDALRAAAGGNPNAAHTVGRAARTVLEGARERIGAVLERSPHEVVFTSGGTEADQLAVVGTYRAAVERGGGRHVVCSRVEHPAVRDAVNWLVGTEGAEVTWVGPQGPNPVATDAVRAALRDDTVLVAVTGADGEVGVVQHSAAIAALCRERGVPLHSDVVQRVATLAPPPTGSLAVSGHKLGAPVGIGVAVLPRDVPVRPLVPGPGQERGLRSGTQPAALAAALATALELAVHDRPAHAERATKLTQRLAHAVGALDGCAPTVAPDADHRLPTHLHLAIGGVDAEALALALDAAGVAASTGTACATGTATTSPTLDAYGITADATLRCSVGWSTSDDDVDRAADVLVDTVTRLRATGGGFL